MKQISHRKKAVAVILLVILLGVAGYASKGLLRQPDQQVATQELDKDENNFDNLPQCDVESDEERSVPYECQFSVQDNRFTALISESSIEIFSPQKELVSTLRVGEIDRETGEFTDKFYRENWFSYFTRPFMVEDVTFDGNEDIVLLVGAGAYNEFYSIYPFISETEGFSETPAISITNLDVDKDQKLISEYGKNRGLGDLFTNSDYAYENGAYVLVWQMNQEAYVEDEDWNILSYKNTTKERVNGEMVIVSEEIIPADEIWGE